ncbi:MAG: DUF4338 domain-containing protein [Gammaproteobacteria bacterium]|nr:DUF4338 domain-containing protein [Gammaproteobacteria bacterium]MDH3469299.1 DUF4338 domain-containing protein [Gammaproteobacteria bacterium]
MSVASYRYCGRNFTTAEFKIIDTIIRTPDHPVRAEISRRVCRELRWYRPNGQLKDMSCRVALLRMQRDGLISLPLPRNGNGNGNIRIKLNARSAPGSELSGRVDNYPFDIEIVDSTEQSRLWNEYIARYHYLGYTPLPGAQIRYMVKRDQKVLAVLGFGAAAWKMAPRDRWIGWTTAQRQYRLPFIANNSRFLILPWVRVKNLASAILGAIARRIVNDWQMRYHHPVCMLETLVEKKRFAGTSYRAANWLHLGSTQGRGKLDRAHRHPLPVKDIYVYPLTKDFRKVLSNEAD